MKTPFDFPFSFSRREAVRIAIPVLALALVASVVTGREKPSVVQPDPASHLHKKASSSEKSASDADLDVARLKRPEREDDRVTAEADPFARRSFNPAPAPQAQAQAEAPAPQAPQLPFTYLGKVIEDGKLSVFLARGDDSFSLPAGKRQKIDEQYRVDKVTETQVVFTYLPMNTKQILDIPAVNQ